MHVLSTITKMARKGKKLTRRYDELDKISLMSVKTKNSSGNQGS